MLRNKNLLTLALLAGCVIITAVGAQEEGPMPGTELKTLKDQVSYAIGQNIGSGMAKDELDLNPDLVAQGIKDALLKAEPLLSQDQCDEAIDKFQKQMQEVAQKKAAAAGEKNVADGKAFLEKNATAEGVTVTKSGLQYKKLVSGKGKTPKAADKVKVHYEGKLINGEIFDSSKERGEPIVFPVNGVIKGWTEALQLMKEGDKWMLYIPSEIAYGKRGAGGAIGPDAVLVFEVELLEVNPK